MSNTGSSTARPAIGAKKFAGHRLSTANVTTPSGEKYGSDYYTAASRVCSPHRRPAVASSSSPVYYVSDNVSSSSFSIPSSAVDVRDESATGRGDKQRKPHRKRSTDRKTSVNPRDSSYPRRPYSAPRVLCTFFDPALPAPSPLRAR